MTLCFHLFEHSQMACVMATRFHRRRHSVQRLRARRWAPRQTGGVGDERCDDPSSLWPSSLADASAECGGLFDLAGVAEDDDVPVTDAVGACDRLADFSWASSAAVFGSCFFHLVRRFWNHILICKTNRRPLISSAPSKNVLL